MLIYSFKCTISVDGLACIGVHGRSGKETLSPYIIECVKAPVKYLHMMLPRLCFLSE
jgi:hypothetical protein